MNPQTKPQETPLPTTPPPSFHLLPEPAVFATDTTSRRLIPEPASYVQAAPAPRRSNNFADRYPRMFRLLQKMMKQDNTGEVRRVAIQAELDGESVVLDYRLQLITRKGLLTAASGQTPLSHILAPSRRVDAVEAFGSAMTQTIAPIVAQFHNLLNLHTIADEPNFPPGSEERELLPNQLSAAGNPRRIPDDRR
jgi:hypothetical protein